MFRLLRAFDATEETQHRPDADSKHALVKSGTSNGVDYVYSAHTQEWFGSYEFRIQRCLLYCSPKEFRTMEFSIGGYKWQLKLVARRSGVLSAYVISRNAASVNAHFSLTLVNRSDRRRNKSAGWNRIFEPYSAWGFSELCMLEDVREDETGFLLEQHFVVLLEMRLRLPENEEFSVVSSGASCTCKWRLYNVDGMSPFALRSEEFSIGDSKWYISFLPGGPLGNGRRCGAYLSSEHGTPIRARIKITALNHFYRKPEKFEERVQVFKAGVDSYGWSRFLPRKALGDPKLGFVKNGWFTLVAEVTVEDDGLAVSPAPSVETRESDLINDDEEDDVCVFCLENRQTSGFVHNNLSHRCVCAACCEALYNRKANCPICRERVDHHIIDYS